jgi:PKD repeat protein
MPGAVLAPVAQFNAAHASGEVTLTVHFTDQSTNVATAWLWDFSDASTSAEQHPVHVYAVPGIRIVTLSATNAAGSDRMAASSLINVSAGRRVYLPAVFRVH